LNDPPENPEQLQEPPPRTPPGSLEMLLGVVGAIVGALAIGGRSTFTYSRVDMMFNQWAEPLTLGLMVVGLVAVALWTRKPRFSGFVMIVVAFLGLVTVGFYYVPASILLVLAGLLSVRRKPKTHFQGLIVNASFC
jgi:hypothetical protein